MQGFRDVRIFKGEEEMKLNYKSAIDPPSITISPFFTFLFRNLTAEE